MFKRTSLYFDLAKAKRLDGFKIIDLNKNKNLSDMLSVPRLVIMREEDHKKTLPRMSAVDGSNKVRQVEKLP